ncbi:MAG: SRPBCC family protein [Candidatus Rokubacteria bacterium]|nr:SRPBCC family protein [Candidatus Rokubacteria bacterium]
MTMQGGENRATVEAVEARRGFGDFASGRNVGDNERVMSIVAGTALALFGLRRFSLVRLGMAAVGASMVRRGVTGFCALYDKAGINTTGESDGVRGNLGTKIERAIQVYAPADRVYRFWRNFSNLPRVMDYLESVTVHDNKRSHWVAKGPGGVKVEWDAEVINDVPNKLIAWRSLGGHIDHAGSVNFEDGPGGRGTTVRVSFQYEPPGGSATHALATLLGGDAGARVDRDLQNLKRVVESGEAVA